METTEIQVKGMTCQHCVKAVESALDDIGIRAKADLASGKVELAAETTPDMEQVKAAIEEEGYQLD